MVFLCSPRWQLFQNIVKGNLKLSQLKWYILMGTQIFILNYLSTIWRFLYLILRVQLESPWRLRRYYNFCYIMSHSWFVKPKCVIQDGSDGCCVCWGVCVYVLIYFVKIYGWGWWHCIVSLLFIMLSYLFGLYMCCQLAAYICIFSVWFLFLLFLSHQCFFWTA